MNTARTFYNHLNTDRAEADRSNRIINAAAALESREEVSAGREAAARLIRDIYSLRNAEDGWRLENRTDLQDWAIVFRHQLTGLAANGVTILGKSAAYKARDYEAAIDAALTAKRGSN